MTIRGRTIKRSVLVVVGLILLDVLLIATQVLSPLAVLLSLGLIVLGWFKLGKILLRRTRVIWRLRNRLYVTYIFIAVVPILLILALAGVGTYFVVGQVAAYLVTSELDRRAAALANPARILAEADPKYRAAIVQEMAPLLRERMPGFEILVTGDRIFRYPENNELDVPPDAWKDYKDYSGSIVRDGKHYCMALARRGNATAIVCARVTPAVLGKLVPGIGALKFIDPDVPDRSAAKAAPDSRPVKISVNNKDIDMGGQLVGTVPPAYNTLDFEITWLSPVAVANWRHPSPKTDALLVVNTRPSAVLGTVFPNIDWAQGWQIGFLGLACLLAAVELVSAMIGFSMTRTITSAVNNLYEGTLRIGQGDFAYRIPVRGYDQLADLGKSFNKMSAQLENLIVVAKEKERMQSELAIASEVQNQLFPRTAPKSRTIELMGACQPARSASGDYYDYLCLPNDLVALALGDVAGKGISAALLMASIQSIMRTQLAAGLPMAAAAGYDGRVSSSCATSGMVAQLNRQLYANTSPEKYATFFFGLYDERSRILTYTNAGHLPPLLVHGNDIRLLDVTGTVVGLFPSIQYEEQTVSIAPGDLLVAYTDGITEPENAYGEEFGEQRLKDTVLRYRDREPCEIVAKIMEAVKQWSTAPELPDDMTVVIARGVTG